MQTFLPYSCLARSVSCLDPSRLGNQVYRECLTLIRGGWPHHPASRMWRGYEYHLAQYALYGLEELARRGRHYPEHVATFQALQVRYGLPNGRTPPLPPWLGDERLHSSHRSVLLYKDYSYYSQFGWTEKAAWPNAEGKVRCWWPV